MTDPSITNVQRREEFRPNQGLESLLTALNDVLSEAETNVQFPYNRPKYPVVFVIGAPRSGTTLLMQWLASTGLFCYPTNLMSRFYRAPYVGSLIQQLLTNPKFQYRDELVELTRTSREFASDLGKTSGILQPNEFWYFWRRFFPIDVPQHVTDDIRDQFDPAGFAKGVAAIESVFDLPFATKGMLLQYDLGVLATCFEKSLFLFTQRDLTANAASLLRARENYYGDTETWYSAKPPEYDWLRQQPVEVQVVGQVELTNQAIKRQLSSMPAESSLAIEYESFCRDPEKIFARICQRCGSLGYPMTKEYPGPDSFSVRNHPLDTDQTERLATAATVIRTAKLR